MTKKKTALKQADIVYEEFESSPTVDKYNLEELLDRLENETVEWSQRPKKDIEKPQPHILFRRGVHYHIQTPSMQHLLYNWKYRYDYPLSLRTDPNGEWIRVLWMID